MSRGRASTHVWRTMLLASAIGSAPATASAQKPSPTAAKGSEKAIGDADAKKSPAVKTEESKEGVKTYTFDAVEVEGRLKSPQVMYFLRRVRAEFRAGELGHRSFLLELSDTRRHTAIR